MNFPCGVHAKPCEAFNNATSRRFLGNTTFLKIVNGYFSDTETHNYIWRLRVQNIKYLMNLQKNICVSERHFIKFFHKIYMEKMSEDLFWVSIMFKQK